MKLGAIALCISSASPQVAWAEGGPCKQGCLCTKQSALHFYIPEVNIHCYLNEKVLKKKKVWPPSSLSACGRVPEPWCSGWGPFHCCLPGIAWLLAFVLHVLTSATAKEVVVGPPLLVSGTQRHKRFTLHTIPSSTSSPHFGSFGSHCPEWAPLIVFSIFIHSVGILWPDDSSACDIDFYWFLYKG